MRKILLTMLVTAMALSMAGGVVFNPAVTSASDYITIDDMPSANEMHTVTLDDNDYETEYGYPYLWDSNTAGLKRVATIAPDKTYEDGYYYTSKLHIVDAPTAANENNKALQFEAHAAMAIVTASEKEKMTIDVTLDQGTTNEKTIKAFLGEKYNGSSAATTTCYIYGEVGKTKYWVNKTDSYTEEELKAGAVGTATTPSNNKWFSPDGKVITNHINETSITFPEISNGKYDEDGNAIGVYSAGFKFMYPNISGCTNTQLTLDLKVGEYSYAFNIYTNQLITYKNGITNTLNIWVSESEHQVISSSKATYLIGKTADTIGTYGDSSKLTAISAFKDNEWNDILVVGYLEDEIFRIYVNGKPLFIKESVGDTSVYTSEFYLPKTTTMPTFRLSQARTTTSSGNQTVVDDMTVKYDAETLASKLTWKKISNNQGNDTVISDLNLLETITISGQTHSVMWASSNENVISKSGKVTRGELDETVTLTATANGKYVSFEVTVKGTVGNTTIYLAGDSTMCDYGENYYPQQGWGYYFKDYFKQNTIVVNAAAGGHSAKTFYTDPARFENSIYNKLIEGDYVFISFGINDAYKLDTNDDESDNSSYTYNYTDKSGVTQSIYPAGSDTTEYVSYLDKMCDAVIAKQAKPVLVTPCNVGSNRNSCSAYVEAMKAYAASNNIPLVDLNKSHNDYINLVKPLSITPKDQQTGDAVPEYVKEEMNLYKMVERGFLTSDELVGHPNTAFKNSGLGTDLIHLSENGAQIIARWVAQGVYKSKNSVLKALADCMLPDEIQSTIYTAGDSLMFSWSRWWGLGYYPYQGWGAYIDDYMDGVKVSNTAMSGETTASFYYQEAYMPTIRKSLNHGDYLLVSLGTNDSAYQNNNNKFVEGVKDENGNPVKWGATLDEYETNLIKYIEDMRKRNVNIVFVTSPTFSTYDSVYAYFDKMKEVAAEYDVPVIDVRQAHLDYIDARYPSLGLKRGDSLPEELVNEFHMTQYALKNTFGFTDDMITNHPQGSNMLTFNGGKGDYTHFNISGAKKIAKIAMGALRDSTDMDLAELRSFIDEAAFEETDDWDYDELSVINYDKTNGIMVYNPDESYSGASLIVASYDSDNVLKSVVIDQNVDISAYTTTILPIPTGFSSKDASFLKIFVLRDMRTMVPLGNYLTTQP